MEVHQHTHTPRKKWHHYFWEFLMLFLAVTLGFLTENLREDIKNKREIKTDMRSIAADLRSDANYFDSVITKDEYCCKMADSLIYLLHNDRTNTAEIYYLARVVTANLGYFFSNAKTFDQMKSSGALKLVAPRSMLDSLGDYYSSMQWLTHQTNLMRLKVDAVHLGNSALFDSYTFHLMMHIDYGGFHAVTAIKRPEGSPLLLSSDYRVINDVIIRYHYLYSTTKFYDKTAGQISQQAKRLIALIDREYKIDDN